VSKRAFIILNTQHLHALNFKHPLLTRAAPFSCTTTRQGAMHQKPGSIGRDFRAPSVSCSLWGSVSFCPVWIARSQQVSEREILASNARGLIRIASMSMKS
jgi:hypothetical protein